jgi:cell division protein FtsB
MDCFVAVAPLRKRFAFVAGNDGKTLGVRVLRIPLTGPSHLARMVSRTRLKSILTGLALYTMAAMMVGYFGVNAYTGKYGLNARQELDQEIIALTSELARLKRERAQGEQRVSLLRSDRVDPDMLDERARFQLDYANPRDLVRVNRPN